MSGFVVTETIQHGAYRNVRSGPFAGWEDFRRFLAESPYAPSDVRTDALGLPVAGSKLDDLATEGYHALSIGRTWSHGWANYAVHRPTT